MVQLGKMLLGFGVLLVILGIVLIAVGNVPGKVPWLGRLPGDIYIEHGNWTFYFPLGTSILISLVLSLILFLLARR